MRNFETRVVEKIKTFYGQYPPRPENLAVYEIMQKNTVESNWPQMI